MKRAASMLLGVLLSIQMAVVPIYAAEPLDTVKREIHVMGGNTTADVVLKNGTAMVSFDSLSFYLGAGIGQKAGMKYMSRNEHSIAVEAGTTKALVDDKEVTMPIASFVKDDELYVPLSFVVQSLGYMVYWREATQTIYIQDPNYYLQALTIAQKSLTTVQTKPSVITGFVNYTNLSSDQPERLFVESKGTLNTDMKNNVAKQEGVSTIYYGYYDSIQKKPVQIYVSTDPVESWTNTEFVTANGIYVLNSAGGYTKEPVPPENISTMDMATKSIQTDPNLFLYSATVHNNYDGTISVKAETDIGILLKVGFDIYLPEESNSLAWSETYQTITYDEASYLPKELDLHLRANYKYDIGEYQKIYLDYSHTYQFDFNTTLQLSLPSGAE